MAVYFMGIIFVIVTSNRISPYLNDYICNRTNTYSKLQNEITHKFEEKNAVRDNTILENQIITIKSYALPEPIQDKLIKNNTEEVYKKLLVTLFDEYVSSYLARSSIKALSFIIVFVILWLAFRIVVAMADFISKIPIIKGLNKFAGGFTGFVEALILTWIFFFFVIIFIGNDFGENIMNMVKDSTLLTAMFNSNIFLDLIP